jgi:ElaB/YqjD/DUF883 family membrane-anchored ribosome-binding protein
MENTIRGNNGKQFGLSKDVESTVSKASAGAHAAVDSMAVAADEAARKVKPAIDSVASMAHQAVDKAAGVAAPTAEWLVEHGEALDATQKKLVADVGSYVSANPLKAIGIAVVAGFVLSRFVR